jgi:hypothetical protein
MNEQQGEALDQDFPPPVGPLSPVEFELIQAIMPALATGDNGPLLEVLEAILHTRASAAQWAAYEQLDADEKLAVLQQFEQDIPGIPHETS